MEISFEEPYEDLSRPFVGTFKPLQPISTEKFNREVSAKSTGKRYINESPPSPLSLNEENKEDSIQIYRFPLSQYTSESFPVSKSRPQAEIMHNQLKKPDFGKISQIYKQHHEETTYKAKFQAKSLPRPSSVQPSRKGIVQELIKEREEKFKEQCTFKPKINENSVREIKKYNSKNNLTLQQRIAMLARPKSEQNEKREKLKREMDEEKYLECTFKPSITQYKWMNRSFSGFSVQERLYQDAEAKFLEKERVKREKEEENIANFPFRPQIQASVIKLVGAKSEKPPIYQRISEIQKEIAENRNNIRLQAENSDLNLTFHPKINTFSHQLANSRKTRPFSTSFRNDSHQKRYHTATQFASEDKFTFTPQISTHSSNFPNDFLKRQAKFQENSKLIKEKLEKNAFTFTPEIDKISNFIVASDKSRNQEKIEERLIKNKEKNWNLKAKLQEDHYSHYKFEPEINEISKNIGKSRSLNEIAGNSTGIWLKRRKAEEKAAVEEKRNTFTPTTRKTRKFEYVLSSYKQSENISTGIKERENLKFKRIEEKKREKEYDELKECTFTPDSTFGRSYQSPGRVNIKGIERFLELKAIKDRKCEEERERENKVFFKYPKGNCESFYTIPKPFNLHPSSKAEKIQRVKEEIQNKERKECRFRPQTTE